MKNYKKACRLALQSFPKKKLKITAHFISRIMAADASSPQPRGATQPQRFLSYMTWDDYIKWHDDDPQQYVAKVLFKETDSFQPDKEDVPFALACSYTAISERYKTEQDFNKNRLEFLISASGFRSEVNRQFLKRILENFGLEFDAIFRERSMADVWIGKSNWREENPKSDFTVEKFKEIVSSVPLLRDKYGRNLVRRCQTPLNFDP
jgi:hypothetical protein